MTDWLLLLKIALGTVLLFDVILLLRRPAEGAVVTTLPASEELRRKGVNMVLMPLVVAFILVLDLLQGNSPLPSLTLLALTMAYLALPRSLALESDSLLLDGWRIPLARVLSVKPTEDGVAVSLERFGWLTEQNIPTGAVANALLERYGSAINATNSSSDRGSST